MSLRLGLIGHPVSHSLSPPMHRAAILFFGLAGTYELIDIEPDELEAAIYRMAAGGFSGFNVTIPHKEAVYRLLKRHSLEAALVGAANTVRIDSQGRMTAHNTDLGGFIQALRRAWSNTFEEEVSQLPQIENALVLGAGGVARACIAGLFLAGCGNIVVAARRPNLAEESCKSVGSAFFQYLSRDFCPIDIVPFDSIADSSRFSLVLNCTPVGLAAETEADCFEAVINSMNRQALLFDSVYRRDRSPTLLMRKAAARGIKSVDGLDMLVEQAALAFEYWTSRRPHPELMRKAID